MYFEETAMGLVDFEINDEVYLEAYGICHTNEQKQVKESFKNFKGRDFVSIDELVDISPELTPPQITRKSKQIKAIENECNKRNLCFLIAQEFNK